MKKHIRSLDEIVSTQVATWPRTWLPFFTAVTILGTPELTLLITGVLMGIGAILSSLEIFTLGLIGFVALNIGSALKLTIRRRRPDTHYANSMRMRTYSFPSGHSVGAMVVYGSFAWLALQFLPAWLAFVVVIDMILLILAIGVSRVYLGAHYASDVLAGWLLGAVGVLLFVVTTLL